jgi:hypothetical protein
MVDLQPTSLNAAPSSAKLFFSPALGNVSFIEPGQGVENLSPADVAGSTRPYAFSRSSGLISSMFFGGWKYCCFRAQQCQPPPQLPLFRAGGAAGVAGQLLPLLPPKAARGVSATATILADEDDDADPQVGACQKSEVQ